MPDKLPKGWVKTTLAEVCARVATIRPEDSPDIEFTYFDIGGIDNQSNRIVETKTFLGYQAPSRARQSVRKDDILFSTVRTNLKKIARIEQDFPNPVASTGFAAIRAAEAVLPLFLFWQVLSEDFLQPLHRFQSGSSYPAVRDKDVFAQPIRLAPTNEQERIVAKLDTLLSRLAAGEAAARRALHRLERYRVTVLQAAVTGKLTSDWRKTHPLEETGAQVLKRLSAKRRDRWEDAELKRLRAGGKPPKDEKWKKKYKEPAPPRMDGLPHLPTNWKWARLEMIAEIGSGMSVSQNRLIKNSISVPYLRVGNVLRGRLDLSKIRTIRVNRDQLHSLLLQPGDILFNEGGDRDKLGRGWIWEGQIPKCIHQNHVFRARLMNQSLVDPRLISHWGNTFGQRFFMRHGTQTVNLASINRSVLAQLPVPLIPVAEQSVIIQELDRRLKAADRLATTLNRQLKQAGNTRQSLLREAFAGKLIAQDPTDEPASVLQQRIRAAREAEAKKPKAKRMPKRNTTRTRRSLLDVLREHKKPITPEQLFREAHFQASEVDSFYRELASLRKLVREKKPVGAQARAWPQRSKVVLELRRGKP
jgi:type I restriction enzyme S subunit